MKKIRLSGIIIYTLVTLFSLCCILPMVLVFMVSITDERAIGMNGYSFFPEAFSLEAYRRMIYPGSPLFRSYGVTIVMVVAGTFLAVIMTYFAAYPETKSQGLFHQIHKEVTFCGLPHGADA